MNTRTKTLFALTALALTSLVPNAAAKDIPAQLPDPDGKAPATDKPVKALQEDFLKLKFGMFIHFNLATYWNQRKRKP